MINRRFTSIFLGVVFFVIGVITLPHYGINWDTINHLPRGQAYLNYYLSGKHDYSNLLNWKYYWQKPESLGIDTNIPKNEIPSRSFYQSNAATFNWYMEYDGGGHPPLSDILSSVFNGVLFGKLRLINDIDSYRIYGVLLAAISVGLIYFWASGIYGSFAGLISAIALASYPLFWAESHFNTEKDVPETAFWILFMFSFWKGTVERKWKWLLTAGLFFGFALGTKFNILFSAFVVIPWLLFYLVFDRKTFSLRKLKKFLTDKKLLLSLMAIPIIGAVILIASWPYLWLDILERLKGVMSFYGEIGLTTNRDSRFLGPLGINTFPLLWIFYTTPIITLTLSIIGILAVLPRFIFEKNKTSILFLLWFAVPVIRVVWPGMTIYGGVRQIMEYIPAMALLAGLGAKLLVDFFKLKSARVILTSLIFLSFALLVANLSRIHPNENVYFNFLTGGLEGAKKRQIPSWGNSFGAAYRQGISWINKNAEPGSKLVYAYELMPNIPGLWVRPDIIFHNSQRSGFLRDGEYAITLTYYGTADRSYYDRYLENTLEPVYETKVGNVSILKIWKNDLEHSKTQYKKQVTAIGENFGVFPGKIEIDLEKEVNLSYLDIAFEKNNLCQKLISGKVSLSGDNKNWSYQRDLLPTGQISIFGVQPSENRLVYSFLGERAKYIKIEYSPTNACLGKARSGKVFQLPDL